MMIFLFNNRSTYSVQYSKDLGYETPEAVVTG